MGCRKKDVPYCIIKGKSRLGKLVHKKTASCVALTAVRKEDSSDLERLVQNFKAQFNDNADIRRTWGGGIMGIKSKHVMERRNELSRRSSRRRSASSSLEGLERADEKVEPSVSRNI